MIALAAAVASNPPQPAAFEHNGQAVTSELFYAIACDPGRNVAVEACAGAGKTWMLVSRIVRALLAGVDAANGQPGVQPHEILAITFTKRAASEMRERLYQWLGEFAIADTATLATELALRGVSGLDNPQVLTRLSSALSQLYQSILLTGRQVQIRTFHSWFAALLRSAPLAILQQLELPSAYDLLEDDATAKAQVWRRFYAALVDQPAWQADFAALVLEHGRFQAEKALQSALDKRVEFALADATGVVDRSVLHFTQQFADFHGLALPEDLIIQSPENRLHLQNAAVALGRANAPTFSAKGAELQAALSNGDMPGAFAALLTKEGAPRKFGEKIAGIERVRVAQQLVLQVLAARNQHDAWQHQQRMARLSRVLIEQYAALKRERGWVDMNDVERAARVMLGDAVLSGWVQQRLDATVRHLLIDEFQDTNPLQWQALLSWLGSYAGSGGGSAPSVFLVGDPKQSIYRFRRAEPQVFKAAQAFVREGLGGDLLKCDHTRRNAVQVISTVNRVMLAVQNAQLYHGFRAHTTSETVDGSVCKLPAIARDAADSASRPAQDGEWRDSLTTPQTLPEETLRTLEARQAAAWIALQIEGGTLPQNIMALSRKRASLSPLQDELRRLHIAAQIGEKTELIDCCEVQDIVALLDVLVSPQHDLSLARVLKSPLFGLADTALVELALLQKTRPIPWFHLLQQRTVLDGNPNPIAATLTRWGEWVAQLPPHDALQAIYDDGDVLARFAAAAPAAQRSAVLTNLNALLGIALQLDGGRFLTPYRFVRALKSGGVQAPAAVIETAVRLLTIHGAKGLEAEVVLLLDTDSKPRNPDSMGVLVDWPGESAEPVKFVFLASESNPPACVVPTLAAEVEQRQHEELNALYVAMTRARHTLAISSIAPAQPNAGSWWARLTDPDADVAEADMPTANIDPAGHRSHATPVATEGGLGLLAGVPLTEGRFYIKQLPAAPLAELSGAAAMVQVDASQSPPESPSARVGRAMHRLLQWGSANPQNASSAAREFDLTTGQGNDALRMAQCILQGAGAWAWDAATVGWQSNEVELSYQGELLRLDRLVQRRDTREWWVLDYKTNAAPQLDPELMAQLNRYRDAVQAIYPGQAVRAAFLTGQGDLVELPAN